MLKTASRRIDSKKSWFQGNDRSAKIALKSNANVSNVILWYKYIESKKILLYVNQLFDN